MPKFYPIDAGVHFNSWLSSLILFDWEAGVADFILPEDEANVLRIIFEGDVIARLLDEMPLSTETHPDTWEGLVPYHFAYRVEGSQFAEHQSEAWKAAVGPCVHYQFVTGNGCLDVLSSKEPRFAVMPRRPQA